jgi:hypothetical protein
MTSERRVMGKIARSILVFALACGPIVLAATPAFAQPPAHAGGRLICQPGQEVEIAINWIGDYLTVKFGNVDGPLFEERIFEGGLAGDLSVVRTKLSAVQWDAYTSGDNGFDSNPQGPWIERFDQRCVDL